MCASLELAATIESNQGDVAEYILIVFLKELTSYSKYSHHVSQFVLK